MTNYKIKVKRDFGQYGYYNHETRKNERSGFVVTDRRGCNIIPGACWFRSIDQAFIGIKAHMITGDKVAWHAVYKKLWNEDVARSSAREMERQVSI